MAQKIENGSSDVTIRDPGAYQGGLDQDASMSNPPGLQQVTTVGKITTDPIQVLSVKASGPSTKIDVGGFDADSVSRITIQQKQDGDSGSRIVVAGFNNDGTEPADGSTSWVRIQSNDNPSQAFVSGHDMSGGDWDFGSDGAGRSEQRLNGFDGSLFIRSDGQVNGSLRLGGGLGSTFSPPNVDSNGQGGSIYQGIGVPDNAKGNDGDICFRTDTPAVANQRIYIKSAGVWLGIV